MKKIFISSLLEDTIILPTETTHHVLHVLRHPFQKPIIVADKNGNHGLYQFLEEVDGRAVMQIIEYQKVESSQHQIVLVQSFLKGDKFDWVLQKATELNVGTIYATSTANCVAQYDRKKLHSKKQRWEKIIQEASQQCGRYEMPNLVVDMSVDTILARETSSICFVAYEDEKGTTLKEALSEKLHEKEDNQRILIFIGPEGGFSRNEVEHMVEYGVQPVSLGHNILRAETAAIASMAMIEYEVNL